MVVVSPLAIQLSISRTVIISRAVSKTVQPREQARTTAVLPVCFVSHTSRAVQIKLVMPCGNNRMGFSVRYVRLWHDSLAAEKRQTLKFWVADARGGGCPFRKHGIFA